MSLPPERLLWRPTFMSASPTKGFQSSRHFPDHRSSHRRECPCPCLQAPLEEKHWDVVLSLIHHCIQSSRGRHSMFFQMNKFQTMWGAVSLGESGRGLWTGRVIKKTEQRGMAQHTVPIRYRYTSSASSGLQVGVLEISRVCRQGSGFEFQTPKRGN